jgi:hypothetical protein
MWMVTAYGFYQEVVKALAWLLKTCTKTTVTATMGEDGVGF